MSMFQVPDFGVADEDEQPVNQTLPVVAAKIGIPSPADWGALAFALILVPVIAYKVLAAWAKGSLAAKTNAAEA